MKLPDAYSTRPTPRFGGGFQVAPVVDSGTSALGAAIAGFGEVLAKEQIKEDKYKVEDATTQLKQRMLELSKGENGFIHTRSGDVGKTFFDDNMTLFDSAREDISKGLSESQAEIFSRRADVSRVGHGENLVNHITRERDTYNGQVYAGGIATEIDIAATDYDNPSEVAQSLLRTKKLTETEADRLGLKGDTRKILLKTNESNIHESVIRQAVDNNQYGYAKEWFERNKKSILGERLDDISDLLNESGLLADSQQAVDDYVLNGMDESEARAEARKLKPELREKTLSLISSRYGEINQIRDSEQKDAGEQAWTIFAESGLEAVPLSLLREMDGKERLALEKVASDAANGREVKTNKAELYRLRKLISDDPISFNDYNLMKSAHLLSTSDFEEMAKLQTSRPKQIVSRTKSQIMKQGAINAGVSSGQVKQGHGDELEAFYSRVDDEIAAHKELTGRDAETKDIQDITDRVSIEVLRRPDWPIFKGGRAAISVEIEGVPTDMVDELALSVSQAGQPVTDENIKLLWDYMNGISPITPKVEKKRYTRYAR